MTKNLYTTGSLYKGMLRYAGPFLLATVLQNLYGTVDLLVVGHFATTADVSAVTIGSQVMNMATQLILGFATGTTVLLGRYFGARDDRAMSRTVGASIVLFGVLAVIFTGALLAGTGGIVRLMQTPAAAVGATRAYLLTCAAGIVFIVGYNLISGMLMGLGDTKTPSLFVAVACVINIVLDIVLVRYAGLGAQGAAMATVAAQAGSVVFSLLYLKRRGLGFKLLRHDVRWDTRRITGILKIGGPVALQNSLVSLSFLFITAIINGMGLAASAAVGVTEKLISILFMPAIAFGSGVATISAQNIGAGQPKRAYSAMWAGVWLGLVPSALFTFVCQFAGEPLAGLFNNDPLVVGLAAEYLRSYVFDCALVSFIFCMNGYFNSTGYSWFTLLHSVLTTLLGRIPLSFLFSRMQGASLYTVGWAAPLSTLASLLMCLVFLRWMRRHRVQIIGQPLADAGANDKPAAV